MAFGKRLRFFRTRKGLTQKQVGEAVKETRPKSAWHNTKQKPAPPRSR